MKSDSKKGRLSSALTASLPGIGVALLAFVLYLRTLAPTALPRDPYGLADSGLLQVRAYIMGISNPTGYPTYMMLAKLFTFLPFGDVGYRVSLASAVYAAVAVFLIYAVCRKLTGRAVPSVAAALLFGVGQAFWSQAVIAEVYTLNALFVALIMFVLLLWRDDRRDRYLLLAAFLMGLSMTHHLTSGLLIPAGILFVFLVERRKLLDWRLLLKGAGLFLLALTPYVYLPIRGALNLPLDNYHPDTLSNFLDLVTGRVFDARMFVYSPAKLPRQVLSYSGELLRQFNPVFLIFAWLGFLLLALRDRAACAMLSFLYLGWLFQAVEYGILDVWVYFIPTYLVLSIFIAVGAAGLLDWMEDVLSRLSSARRKVALAVVSVALLLFPLVRVGTSTYAAVDQSGNYASQKTMNAVAATAPRGATIVQNGSSLWYMTLVDKRRTDLHLVNPLANPKEWEDKDAAWLKYVDKYLREGGPVYVLFAGGISPSYAAPFEQAGYRLIPEGGGTFYKVVK